jgi:hypothetical protein
LKARNIRLLPQPREETEQQKQQQEAELQRIAAAATAAANTAEVKAAERAEEAAAAAAAAQQKAAAAKAAAEQAAAGDDEQKTASLQAAAVAAAQEAAAASKRAEDAAAAARLATEQAAATAAHYAIEETELDAALPAAAAATAAAESAKANVEAATQKSPAAAAAAAVELPAATAAPALPGMASAGTRRDMLSMQLGHRTTSSMVNCDESDKLLGGPQPEQAEQQQRPPGGALHGMQRQLQTNTAALQQQSLLSFEDIRNLQTSIGLHLCHSEREGFGHYLNEARAAAAFIVSTDHPPMNEMIRPEFGVLVTPKRTESYADWQVLAEYAKINAFLDPDDICAAVQKVLGVSVEERAAKGKAARKQYMADKSSFVRKMRRLRLYLAKWRQQGRRQMRREED